MSVQTTEQQVGDNVATEKRKQWEGSTGAHA